MTLPSLTRETSVRVPTAIRPSGDLARNLASLSGKEIASELERRDEERKEEEREREREEEEREWRKREGELILILNYRDSFLSGHYLEYFGRYMYNVYK